MANYSIKDLEHLSGIKAHTLRIWEQRYGITNPKRTETNIRYYGQDDLKLVLNVALLKENGHKISKIAKMSKEEVSEIVLEVSEKLSSHTDQIHALTLSMIDMDEQRFEKIIASNTLKIGFERTMLNIIYPFLSKIGIMWVTDAINPAQEHFMSNLIRQKTLVAIDNLYTQVSDNSKKYMLFLPEGELHELSLLFANLLIRSRNNRTIYLGQNMPFHDLEVAYDLYKPDYLLTILTSRNQDTSPQEYIDKLSSQYPETTILVAGSQIIGEDLTFGENVITMGNPNQMITFVEEHTVDLVFK